LEVDPVNVDALERLVAALVEQGRREEASDALDRLDAAIGDDPRKDEEVTRKRIALYQEMGRLDAVVAQKRTQVLGHEEDLAESALDIAEALEKRGRLSDAITYYSRALIFAKRADADRIRSLIKRLEGRLERGEI